METTTLRHAIGVTDFPSPSLSLSAAANNNYYYHSSKLLVRKRVIYHQSSLSSKFPFNSLSHPPRSTNFNHRFILRATGHDHHHDHHDHDHDHCCHHHHHEGGHDSQLTGPQRALLKFAKTLGWMDLANLLREHLQLCCCSAALFITAAACPYIIPKPAVKPLQNALMLVAFPLVGVPFPSRKSLLLSYSFFFHLQFVCLIDSRSQHPLMPLLILLVGKWTFMC